MFAFYVVSDAVKWRLKVMQIEIPKRESDDLTNSIIAKITYTLALFFFFEKKNGSLNDTVKETLL